MEFNKNASVNRNFSRRMSRQLRHSDEPVMQWPLYDTQVPAIFPEIDVERRKAQALSELERLLRADAVDGAHASALDSLVSEIMAPDYETAEVVFGDGVRIIQMLNGQAEKVCEETKSRAEELNAAAETAEQAADAVYEDAVGLPRVRAKRMVPISWADVRGKWDRSRLTLKPDGGILDFQRRRFRGNGYTPTTPIDDAKDACHSDSRPSAPQTVMAGKSLTGTSSALINNTAEGQKVAPKHVHPLVFPMILLLIFVALLGVSVADPTFTKGTIDVALNQSDFASVLIAICLYGASVVTPIKIGMAEADGKKTRGARVFWIILGIALFLLREFDSVIAAHGDWSYFSWMEHLPLAIVIACLYYLTGIGYMYLARDYMTSSWHLVSAAVRVATKARIAADHAIAIALQAEDAFDTNRIQTSLWSAEYDAHLMRLANAEAEIKDVLRVRLAEHLGDPRESGLMNEGHQGTNANEQYTPPTTTASDETEPDSSDTGKSDEGDSDNPGNTNNSTNTNPEGK